MIRAVLISVLSVSAALAQTDNRQRFLVSDVHTSASMRQMNVMTGPFYGTNRYEVHHATLVDLIHEAYGVDSDLVYGGPSWAEYTRYDVIAKTPPGSNAETRKLMLQSLLEERFGLKLHTDSRPMMAYKLTVDNAKLQESDGSGSGCEFKQESAQTVAPKPDGGPQTITLPVFSYSCKNTSMAAFTSLLPNIPTMQNLFGKKPVVDQTGLKGTYDFVVRFTPAIPQRLPPGIVISGDSIPFPDALKKLGLKLEQGTVPMPAVVVDSALAKPTDNPPDIANTFPPLPKEFEVAEMKPSPPAADGGRGGGTQPELKNGRLIVQGITVKNLLQLAYNIQGDDSRLVGAPKWLDSDRFNLIAKAPAEVQMGDLSMQTQRAMSINIDAIQPMIQTLLAQKFKLQVHTEERSLNAFVLSASKPKMQQADPNLRTKCVEGTTIEGKDRDPKDSKDPRNSNPALGRLITCQNVSMSQLADMLNNLAGGYIQGSDVSDQTGLTGGWNFTLSFSGIGQLQGGGGRGGDAPNPSADGSGRGPEAAAPSGGISLQDAVAKQLGLKLEQRKRPVPVVVIDHIEQKPVEN